MKTLENALARVWYWLALGALACFAVSCAYTRAKPDGSYEEVGEDLVEGVTVGSDVVGAVVEGVERVDPGKLIEDAASGNWQGVAYVLAGVVLTAAGAYAARKKWRKGKVKSA